jgi:hypothetical protein
MRRGDPSGRALNPAFTAPFRVFQSLERDLVFFIIIHVELTFAGATIQRIGVEMGSIKIWVPATIKTI